MKAAVFLDRDGVLLRPKIINEKAYAIRKIKDFKLLPGVTKSIKKIRRYGFLVFVVTNQPDIRNNLVTENLVNRIHKKIKTKLKIDDFAICPHRQNEGCYCRKPNPGMILNLAKKYRINLKKSFMIGDRESDIKAGERANCRTIFINNNYNERKPKNQEATFDSLMLAVDYIILSVT